MGYRLLSEGLLFGGNTLTATDIAVAAGIADLEGDMTKIVQIPETVVSSASEKMHLMVEDVIDQMKVIIGLAICTYQKYYLSIIKYVMVYLNVVYENSGIVCIIRISLI